LGKIFSPQTRTIFRKTVPLDSALQELKRLEKNESNEASLDIPKTEQKSSFPQSSPTKQDSNISTLTPTTTST